MKDRIQQLIDFKGISPGDLAERLDVQRSNISHILNGRNKPGAVFIEKLLQAFPDVNARWLLTGDGSMITGQEDIPPVKKVKQPEESNRQQQLFPPAGTETKSFVNNKNNKVIEKIILLYSDGTFAHYNNL